MRTVDRPAGRLARRDHQALDEIPGIGLTAAHTIVVEIGWDMSRFPNAAHLTSWLKLAPAVKKSDSKRKGNDAAWARQLLPGPHLRRTLLLHRPALKVGNVPWSRLGAPSYSSSGNCYPTTRHTSSIWESTSTPDTPILNARSTTTSASSKPLATAPPRT
ncbi:transposase [Streptosporangium saharense]|uniref:transposase n=1 Tax=Streptosporangium saharense TaxID=1706840 RepID=UPI0036A145B0